MSRHTESVAAGTTTRYSVGSDEWYPVYSIYTDPESWDWCEEFEFTGEAEWFAHALEVQKEFIAIQNRLQEMCDPTERWIRAGRSGPRPPLPPQ